MSERAIIYIVIFAGYIGFMVWGVLKSLRQVESFSDFTTGGHRMGLLLGVGTSVATWVSVASVMGVPGYLYRTGAAAIIGWVSGWFLCTALFPILTYKIRMPKVPMRTFPELLRLRYEPHTDRSPMQITVALLMFVGYFIFTHLQVVGFGIVFNTITGIPYEYAIFGFLLILVLTCSGGFWSVAASDTINAILILFGLVVGCVTVLSATGGVGNIMEAIATTTAPINEGGEPLPPGIMLTATGSFGAGALFSIFISNALGSFVAPHWITRFMAPKNAKAATLQMMWTLLFLVPIFICLIIFGLGAKALLPSLPVGKTTDYIMPLIMDQYAPPIVAALTLVALLAAAVSTANSMLLHCSTSLYYDVYIALHGRKNMDQAQATRSLRFCVMGLGILAVISAIKPPLLLAMGFTYVYGAFGSVFLWAVLLGVYWKKMNRQAAYVSILIGFVTYISGRVTGFVNPMLLSVILSFIGLMLALKFSPPPPLEAYEAFFEEDVSPKTMQTILRIRHEEETQGEKA
ncbi:MAG: sodium:solute symporter family protein [Deltaproteobacteria bacterium]|jgi:sodium/pantothenate symporter|nr:sodium:solute symporter family protein [Deltaproteobacteria bacterium]